MQEVLNFKDLIKGYLHEGVSKLVGHSKPLQYRFYMIQEYTMMQYKIYPTIND